MSKNRLESFSDGVLAIIITIMVLELKIPEGTSFQVLRPVLPELISYFLSFIFIGIYWGNHHHLLHTVQRVSTGIIWANLNLLFWLSLVPIATGWMGENHFASNSVAIYMTLLAFCGFAYYILQRVILKHHDFNPALRLAMEKQSQKGIISQISYIVSIPLAFLSPLIAGGIFVFVAILWIIPDKNIEKAFSESAHK